MVAMSVCGIVDMRMCVYVSESVLYVVEVSKCVHNKLLTLAKFETPRFIAVVHR